MTREGDRRTPALAWRSLRAQDLPSVRQIAAESHPTLPEGAAVFAEKLRLYPEGCFAVQRDGALTGYALSHPWALNDVPALDALLVELPTPAACLYLHDVALAPAERGRGLVRGLIDLLTAAARERRLTSLALVSVPGTDMLWSAVGFRDLSRDVSAKTLRTYGATARYMRLGI